jgi:transposase-like protein
MGSIYGDGEEVHCPSCDSSEIIKAGVRHNKSGPKQTFFCLNCRKRFVVDGGLKRMKFPPQIISEVLKLSFNGNSSRAITRTLFCNDVHVSNTTITRWIKKYRFAIKGTLNNPPYNQNLRVFFKTCDAILWKNYCDSRRALLSQRSAPSKRFSWVKPWERSDRWLFIPSPVAFYEANKLGVKLKTSPRRYPFEPICGETMEIDDRMSDRRCPVCNAMIIPTGRGEDGILTWKCYSGHRLFDLIDVGLQEEINPQRWTKREIAKATRVNT